MYLIFIMPDRPLEQNAMRPVKFGSILLLLAWVTLDLASQQCHAANSHQIWSIPEGDSGSGLTHRSDHIDAYNPDLCGDANFLPWQREQSAFGCRGRARGGHSRIADGSEAEEGEFPFYARLRVAFERMGEARFANCGGTLIHRDLVITAAHCVLDRDAINVTLGTNRADGEGGLKVRVDKWCHHKHRIRYNDTMRPRFDLAILRLAEPIEYVPNNIAPACLLPNIRHANETTCVVAGLGWINNDKDKPDHLLNLIIKRTCSDWVDDHKSCYMATETGAGCKGDSGSPIVCYDKCGTEGTKAFVVGALKGGKTNGCRPGSKDSPISVVDFNRIQRLIKTLLNVVRYDAENDDTDSSIIECKYDETIDRKGDAIESEERQ